MKLCITIEADRLTVAAILVKNGYTVRNGKELKPGKKTYQYYLEAWTGQEPTGKDGGDGGS